MRQVLTVMGPGAQPQTIMVKFYSEPTTQFLARMILATREGHQISSKDAQRLSDQASFGNQEPPTMPEERRDGSKPLMPVTADGLVP